MNKRDLKSLKNTLGKQGLTLDDLESSSSQDVNDTGIVDLQSFTFDVNTNPDDGWYVGYGVEYNGVGMSNECPTSDSDDDSENVEEEEASEQTSGFSSDPTSEDEHNEDSEGSGDDGQLLYSVGETLFFSQDLTPVSPILHNNEETRNFEKPEITGTRRFKTVANKTPEPTTSTNGYQKISLSQDIAEAPECSTKTLKTHSSGLAHNFVIKLQTSPTSENVAATIPNSDSIPLDDDKISQISKAMTSFTLPTSPGWENVDDSKLLEFIKNKTS